MGLDFRQCASGIVGALLANLFDEIKSPDQLKTHEASQFVLSQYDRMPDYLRVPFKLIAWFFDAAPIFIHGRPFHKLSLATRQQIVFNWKNASLGFKRDFIRFFDTLAIFAWYSERESTIQR